jgi:hypothetical protein
MLKKKIVIIALMGIPVVLHGMKVSRKKTEKLKHKKSSSKQSSYELASSSEDNDQLNQSNAVSFKHSALSSSGGKSSVKGLNDLKEIRRAQSEFRDKAIYSKSDSVSGKK